MTDLVNKIGIIVLEIMEDDNDKTQAINAVVLTFLTCTKSEN